MRPSNLSDRARLSGLTRIAQDSAVLPDVRSIDPKLFYVIEQARDMSKLLKPVYSPLGGWGASDKRK